MGRGDFQGSAGQVASDVRCCAMPKRALQGIQTSWILLQKAQVSTVPLLRAKTATDGGATGPLLWLSMRQRHRKERKNGAWGQSTGSKGAEDWGKTRPCSKPTVPWEQGSCIVVQIRRLMSRQLHHQPPLPHCSTLGEPTADSEGLTARTFCRAITAW